MSPARAALVLTVAAAACGPVTGVGRARTMPPERAELTVGPEVMLVSPKLPNTKVTLPWLQLTGGYHRGLSQIVEVGARVWGLAIVPAEARTFGGALDGKLQLRAQSPAGGNDIALALSVGYHQIDFGGWPQHQISAWLPALIGWRPGATLDVVLGPRVGYQAWFGESQYTQHLMFVGLSVGLAWRFSAHWTFLPELAAIYSPVPFGGEDADTQTRGLSFLSLGLGFGYGL